MSAATTSCGATRFAGRALAEPRLTGVAVLRVLVVELFFGVVIGCSLSRPI
jgi:hypothetical protein